MLKREVVIVSRFDVIEKEINKGVKIDEKSNVVIQGWSPNNVRRLIIGVDYVVVQYFVKVGKYGKLVEVLPITNDTKEDYDSLQNNKYTPILKVLTSNRVISSIEEIVFCVKNYPKDLRIKDMELGVLGKDSNLSNRFVRLHNVSAVSLTVQEIMPYIKESMSADKLLIDALKKDSNIPLKTVLELHTDDWYKGTNLRSRWYSMDKEGSTLHNYFMSLKDSKESEIRDAKLRDIELKKYESLANTKLKSTILVMGAVLKSVDECEILVSNLSIIDKLEWGNTLRTDKIHSVCRRSLSNIPKGVDENYEPFSNKLRRVDIDGLKDIATVYGVDNGDVLTAFDEFSKRLLQYDDNYKRESNKASIVDSVDILQKGVIKLLNAILNSLYLALIQYCNKAGIDNVGFYIDKLNLDVSLLNYSRPLVEYCNKQTKTNDNGDILKAMGCILVEVESISIEYKVKTLKYIINVLKTV